MPPFLQRGCERDKRLLITVTLQTPSFHITSKQETMALFSRKEYWDDRYKADPDSCDEWYQGYKTLRHLLNPITFTTQGSAIRTWNRQPTLLPPVEFPPRDACRILILGCGNSGFAIDMKKDGWTGPIVNLDFSTVVIDQMKKRYSGNQTLTSNMEFVCHDLTIGLPFADESFDLIVCKGTFDAVLCGTCPVADIRTMVQESVRCLKRGHGVFFVVTNGNPDNRLEYLEHNNDVNHYWESVSCHAANRPDSYETDYVYICRRRVYPSSQVSTATSSKPARTVVAAGGKENTGNPGFAQVSSNSSVAKNEK